MSIFWSTFTLIFVAEIADKSRVVGLLLATTYRAPWRVFWGMTLGYALLEGIAVAVGGALPGLIPTKWLEPGAGLLFIVLGVAALALGEEAEEHGRRWLAKVERWGPFVVSFLAIAVSEVADRTQIAATALAAKTGQPIIIYAGSMSALIVLNAVTVVIGDRVSKAIGIRIVHRLAGVCFVLFGVLMLVRGL